MLVYLGCLCLALGLAAGHLVTYNGHKVLEILHKTENDYIKLLNMELKYELDFWKMPKHVNDSMYVRVSPVYLESFLKELNSLNAGVSILIEDVQELLNTTQSSQKHQQYKEQSRRAARQGITFDTYYSYDFMMNYLNSVYAAKLSDGNIDVTIQTLGQSSEGRDVNMIKISSPYGSSPKRGIFIDGGIHAREWIAPATVLYVIDQLAYNPNNRADVYNLLASHDFYLVPVVNPDGYEYSRISNRLWRKNRRDNGPNSCPGVDLNRNFAHQWNPLVGGSSNSCSDIYSGTGPASEPETQAISNFLTKEGASFDAYLTIHSYGQMWLYPWGYTSALPVDWQDLHYAADMATAAIKSLSHQKYTIGSSTNTLYAAAGGSDDFAKGKAGIKYAYTIELRDTGRYGFALPESLIIPTVDEFLEGLVAFSQAIKT